ncbi:MAG: YitT family protein [Clostridia bacterium]|nr:YitT family protein [Clostridia bacterium]
MKAIVKSLPVVIFGNFLMQLGIVLFILPSGLITGGTTGIALILRHIWPNMPISAVVAVFNAAMFLLGWACLGKAFAMTTLVSTIASPAILAGLQAIVGDFVLTDDLLLCTLFGGVCIGAAIAMIIKLGASTGGMDIPPLLLQKFMGIPVSKSLYFFDITILLGQAIFTERQLILYGILLILTYTVMIDKMMALGDQKLQLEIVSEKSDEIRQAILTDVDRGVTLLHGKTGYYQHEIDMIICIVSPRERHRTEQLIRRIDPHAFVVLCQVSRVSGRGFTERKQHLPPRQG